MLDKQLGDGALHTVLQCDDADPHPRQGSLTGNMTIPACFAENFRADSGKIVRKRPLATRLIRASGEIVVTVAVGEAIPRFRKPSMMFVMLGTNDLRNRWAKPEEEVTGEDLIAGLQQMVMRAHSAGIKIIGATITPFGNETYMANAWNPVREMHRVAVNAWIRESGVFDGVADFDAALRDPEISTQMRAVDDCGDGLHPSDVGYCKMGDAIDLKLFT